MSRYFYLGGSCTRRGPGTTSQNSLKDVAGGGLVADGGLDESSPASAARAPSPVGPAPNETQAELRTDVGRSILSCYGLSPALFESSDGAGQREAWRRAWASVFSPIARGMASEISVKLDTPGVELELAELRASDSQGQSRGARIPCDGVQDSHRGRIRAVPGA